MAVLSHDAPSRPTGEAALRDWTAVFSSRWMLAVILLLAFAAYAPTLNDWFVGDDFWFLRASQSSSVSEYTKRVFDPSQTSFDGELNRYRPLYPLAWRLQYEAFGLHASYYHAVVVGLHLACAVLAWFVFRRLFSLPGEAWLANLATLIFAIHPAYADAVAWLSGGNRVFAAFPYIASLLLFMKYRDASERRPWLMYAGSLLAYVAAMLTHSSAITLAAVLVLYTFLIVGQPRDALRPRAWLPFVPFLLAATGEWGIQLYERQHIGVDGFRFGFHMFANYGGYLGLLVVPVETVINTSQIEEFAEKVQLFASPILLLVALAAAYRRPFWGLAIFAVAWFFLALLPDSTFVAGRYGRIMYTPGLAGALWLVVVMLFVRDLLSSDWRARTVVAAPYVLVALLLPATALTYARTRGTSAGAASFERFAHVLQAEGPRVPSGGTLYVSGAPAFGPFSPDSHLVSLVQLYYGDIRVEIVHPGELPPVLGPDDRAYAYTP